MHEQQGDSVWIFGTLMQEVNIQAFQIGCEVVISIVSPNDKFQVIVSSNGQLTC
jgi:hypothetical protein